jgi:ABC-type hemin transport system substrate-binding protein
MQKTKDVKETLASEGIINTRPTILQRETS